MSYKRCIDCGDFYYTSESWKIRCVDCWREWKFAKDSCSTGYMSEERQLTEWGFRLAKWQAELDAQEMWLRQQKSATNSELGPMLSKLLQLCHLDKHKVVHCHSQ